MRLAILGAVAAAVMTVNSMDLASVMPVRYVRVEGPVWNTDPTELQQAVLPLARTGYFAADLSAVQAAVKALPWTNTVSVARVWPDTLMVRIDEQQPVARWGESGLLNGRGEVFTPKNAALQAHLPLLAGPSGQEKLVLDTFNKLNTRLEPQKMRIDKLKLSKRRAWVVHLASGTEIVIGKQDPLAALERFLGLLPELGEERIRGLLRVDLRYPNGFSVVWRPEFLNPVEPLGNNDYKAFPNGLDVRRESGFIRQLT